MHRHETNQAQKVEPELPPIKAGERTGRSLDRCSSSPRRRGEINRRTGERRVATEDPELRAFGLSSVRQLSKTNAPPFIKLVGFVPGRTLDGQCLHGESRIGIDSGANKQFFRADKLLTLGFGLRANAC
jgi:hypothetical protein